MRPRTVAATDSTDRRTGWPSSWAAQASLLTINQTFNLHLFGEAIIDTSFYYLLLGLFLSLAFLAYPARDADRAGDTLV